MYRHSSVSGDGIGMASNSASDSRRKVSASKPSAQTSVCRPSSVNPRTDELLTLEILSAQSDSPSDPSSSPVRRSF